MDIIVLIRMSEYSADATLPHKHRAAASLTHAPTHLTHSLTHTLQLDMSQWSSNLFIFEGSIPDELLTVILSFLVPSCGRDGARAWRAAVLDLVHASSVNHRWYRVANDPSIWWPLVEHHAHDAEVAAMIEQHLAHSGRSSSAAAAAALVRYPTQSVFELLAPKRIAATIFVAKSNMAAGRWKRELGSHLYTHHYGWIARSCSSGSWIVSSDSLDICVWQLMPHASAKRHTSSSVAATKKLPSRLRLRMVLQVNGKHVMAINNDGILAIGYEANQKQKRERERETSRDNTDDDDDDDDRLLVLLY